MNTGHKPKQPQCLLGALQPQIQDTEKIKREAWQEQGILVISIYDCRLSWTDAEFVKQLGDRIFGKLPAG